MSGKSRADGKEVWLWTVLEDLLSIVGRQAQISAKVIGKMNLTDICLFLCITNSVCKLELLPSAERKPGGRVKTAYPDEG